MANLNRVELVAVPAVETLPVRPHEEHAARLESAICHTLISERFAFLYREEPDVSPSLVGVYPH